MDFANMSELISTHGYTVILMAYFLWKDWKFNEQIVTLMGEVKEVLVELRAWHERQES